MLTVIQKGSGPKRLCVIAFFVANREALLSQLPREACVVADLDKTGGRFALPVGRGGVDPIDKVLAQARAASGYFEPSAVVLVGWSAGCQAVREILRSGARPDAVLALDGTSGSCPPTEAQLAPWQAGAERARLGEMLLVLTHTLQVYTEQLPVASRYLSTLSGCRAITGWPLEQAGPVAAPVFRREGGLVVASYRSARMDAAAHVEQQTKALPDLLRRLVLPWLAGERSAQSEPAIEAPPTKREPHLFIASRNYTPVAATRPRKISCIVIHTTEGDLGKGAARAVANWFAGPSAPQASCHYVVDTNEVIACVRDEDVAWGAPGANNHGIQIELVGRAAWTSADWGKPAAQAALDRLASLVAELCLRHGIPVRRLTVEELSAGARGLCGHVDASKAWKKSSHWDPGRQFPWNVLLALVVQETSRIGSA